MNVIFFLIFTVLLFQYWGLSRSVPRSTQLDTQFIFIELQVMNLQ